MRRYIGHIAAMAALLGICFTASAQKYKNVIDKSVAVVGGEIMAAMHPTSPPDARCLNG